MNKQNMLYNIVLTLVLVSIVSAVFYWKKGRKPVKHNIQEIDQATLISKDNKYELVKLPYAYNALEPYIDAKTMEVHYTKHYQAYTDGLNKALENHPEFMGKKPEWLLENINKLPNDIQEQVRDQGGGYLNHTMFWFMMSPKGGGEPTGGLKAAINKEFGSFDKFKDKFNETAKKVFGSGWAWLCLDVNLKLVIKKTKDQDNPISKQLIPILGLDVWEHAYYLKYQNKRLDYIQSWWNVVDWKYVENLYDKAIQAQDTKDWNNPDK